MSEKICLFAGTTEGRSLAAQLSGNAELTACVATEYGEVLLDGITGLRIHTGRMDFAAMQNFFREEGFTLIVDATHPYADKVTDNINAAAEECGIKTIRVLRDEDSYIDGAIYVSSAREAAEALSGSVGNILLTTGSKELGEFAEIERDRVWARVLPLPESLHFCEESGISPSHIIAMQGPFTQELNLAQLRALDAKYLVTKQSGKNGGFEEKIAAARKADVVPVIIGRPPQTRGLTYRQVVRELEGLFGAVRRVKVYIVGIGAGSPDILTGQAREIISRSECLIGAKRMTDALSYFAKPCINEIDPQRISDAVRESAEYSSFAALMSGDTGFYSGAKKLSEALSWCEVVFVPGISSLAYFTARLNTSWDDAALISLHGRSGNLIGAVKKNRRTFALTGGDNDVSSICRKLCEYGLGDALVTVGERLSYPDERITKGSARELSGKGFDSLSVMLIENEDYRDCVPHGIDDGDFIRARVPMTKSEVRAVSLSKLALDADSVVYDIGAGTGSVSVECALTAYMGTVYAVEKNLDAITLIEGNARKFGAENIQIIEGEAPRALAGLPVPTHAFIGGSSGNMRDIISALLERNRAVRIVVNALTLETLAETLACIKVYSFTSHEVTQIGVSRSRRLGGYNMMEALNSVYIIRMENRVREGNDG